MSPRNAQLVADEADKLRRYFQLNPVAYSKQVLGREPWDDGSGASQADVLMACARSMEREFPLVATRSGHKVGKTGVEGIAALWVYSCFHPSTVVLTAPTFRQVEKMVWKEITQLYRGANVHIGGRLYDTPTKGLRHPAGNEVFGLATDDPDKFSGFSGPLVVYIVEEASGLDQLIYDAIDGNRAGFSPLWLFGNPTQVVGTFYDAFHDLSDIYETIHIDSERVAHDVNPNGEIPGLATPAWVKERLRAWGRGSPRYRVRVGGQFPTGGTSNVVSLEAWKKARDRYDRMLHAVNGDLSMLHRQLALQGNPLVNGLDVARYGDDLNALCPRRGNVAFPIQTNGDPLKGPQVAGWAQLELRRQLTPGELDRPGAHLPTVNVDAIGVGASAYDSLEPVPWLAAQELINSERADDPEEFHNLRSQLWWNAGEWLDTVGAVAPDDELRVELLAARYKFDAKGRIQVESKKEMKARIQRSPDRADAFTQACYRGAGVPAKKGRARSIKIRGL